MHRKNVDNVDRFFIRKFKACYNKYKLEQRETAWSVIKNTKYKCDMCRPEIFFCVECFMEYPQRQQWMFQKGCYVWNVGIKYKFFYFYKFI